MAAGHADSAPAELLPGHRKRLLLAAAQLPRVTLAPTPKPTRPIGGRPSSPGSLKDRAEPRLVRRVARVRGQGKDDPNPKP